MTISRHQRGSTHLVLLLAVALIAVAGFAAYRVLNADTPNASSSPISIRGEKDAPNDIKSSADLQKASNALDSTPIDGDINPDQLDSDINAL